MSVRKVRDGTVPDGTSIQPFLRIRVGDPWKDRMHGAGIRSSLDDGGTIQSPKPKPLYLWSRSLTAHDRPLTAPTSLVHVHRWIVDRLDLPGAVTGRGAGLVAAVEPATQRPTGRYSLFRCGFAPRRPADHRAPISVTAMSSAPRPTTGCRSSGRPTNGSQNNSSPLCSRAGMRLVADLRLPADRTSGSAAILVEQRDKP